MKKFFVLWSSQAASLFGSAVVNFALAWYLTRETGSATVLATALTVAMVPPVILGPFAGPLVDRWDRRKIMILADLWSMLLVVVLVVLFFLDAVQIWHIYLIMVGRSIGETFQSPALGASIPMLVPEDKLVRANGLFQMLQYAIRVVAPIAGAFLLETLPMQGVLAVDIVTAVLAVGCLLPLGIPRPPRTTLAAGSRYLSDIQQGFRYVWQRPGLVMLIGMLATLMFFVAAPAHLMPVLVSRCLEGDVVKLGWMGTASGIGGIAGGLLLTAWGGFSKKIRTALLGFAVMIPCSVGVGLTTPGTFYPITVLSMVFMGIGQALVSAPMTAILNTVVAKDMQGRVFALQASVIMAVMPIGLVIGGPVADWLGIRSLYFIASAAWLIILPLAMLSKPLMELEDRKVEKAVPEG